jgi:hypothetical protein
VIGVESSGSFKNTEAFLARMLNNDLAGKLRSYGKAGVQSLSKATPEETGETAHSWDFRVVQEKRGPTIEWFNTHENQGVNIAIIIQYGHGTGTGGWVPGINYVNPAMEPVFDKIMDDFWKEVTK